MSRWGELDGRYDDIDERDRQDAEWSRICTEVNAGGRHRQEWPLPVGSVFHCGDFGGMFLRVAEVGFERIWRTADVGV